MCVTENSKSSRIAIESQPWQKGQSIHFQEAVSVIVIIVHWSFNRPKHRSKTAHGFRCFSSNLRLEIQDQSNNWQLVSPALNFDWFQANSTYHKKHSTRGLISYVSSLISHVTSTSHSSHLPWFIAVFQLSMFQTVETLLAVLFLVILHCWNTQIDQTEEDTQNIDDFSHFQILFLLFFDVSDNWNTAYCSIFSPVQILWRLLTCMISLFIILCCKVINGTAFADRPCVPTLGVAAALLKQNVSKFHWPGNCLTFSN